MDEPGQSLEDLVVAPQRLRALRRRALVVIDEIQRVPVLLNNVQALMDQGLPHCFVLTSSSSLMVCWRPSMNRCTILASRFDTVIRRVHVGQPWAGTGFRAVNLPRVGQEVLVSFLGGDPDRPVIVGRVYTALQTPPYKLPDSKTQSGLRSASSASGGYNEIMMEDAAGKELLSVQAERDLTKLVKNNEEAVVGNNLDELVSNDHTVTIGQVNC
jgi:hypothetical protein